VQWTAVGAVNCNEMVDDTVVDDTVVDDTVVDDTVVDDTVVDDTVVDDTVVDTRGPSRPDRPGPHDARARSNAPVITPPAPIRGRRHRCPVRSVSDGAPPCAAYRLAPSGRGRRPTPTGPAMVFHTRRSDNMINLVALEGRLARPAEQRLLPSGSHVVGIELTVRGEQGPAETVPVSWLDAPAWASTLDTDAAIVVVGRVRRRFFKAGGSTQSRTEVVAETIVPATSVRRARTALARAGARIEEAAAGLGGQTRAT
jgi:single-strand DNA-binding protein